MSRALLALLVSWLAGTLLPAQESPDSQRALIHIQTERVLVDLFVFDSRGRFLEDLKPSEIELRENGVLRPLTNFVLIDRRNPKEIGRASLSSLEQSDYQDRIVVVLDRVSISLFQYGRTLAAIEHLLGGLPEQAQVALFLYTGRLRMLHAFSHDRSSLVSALRGAARTLAVRPLPDRNRIFAEIASLFSERLALGFQVVDTTGQQNLIQRTVEDAVRVSNRYLNRVDIEVRDFFRALERLVGSLGVLSGNKNLLLFSRGYSLLEGDEFREFLRENIRSRLSGGPGVIQSRLVALTNRIFLVDHHLELEDLAGTANRNRVRIYTVDPAGLTALSPTGPASESSSVYQLLNQPDRKFLHDLSNLTEPVDFLIALSGETNGLAFYNRNDLASALDRFVEHNSRYYLLGYEPLTDRQTGKYYKIEVRLRRPGHHRLLTRSGYLYRASNDSAKELHYALAYPGLFREIPLTTQGAGLHATAGPVACISLEIPGERMPFTVQGGSYRCTLDIYGFIFDRSGREVRRFGEPYAIQLTPQEFSRYRRKSFIYYREFPLPPGDYQLRTIIRDRQSRRLGADQTSFRVPSGSGRLSVSSLVLSQDAGPGTAGPSSPVDVGGIRLVPQGDHSLKLGEPVWLLFQIFNLAWGEQVPRARVRVRLLDRTGRVAYESFPHPTPLPGTKQRAFVVWQPLPVDRLALAPGPYRLRVQVSDLTARTQARREITLEWKSQDQ